MILTSIIYIYMSYQYQTEWVEFIIQAMVETKYNV